MSKAENHAERAAKYRRQIEALLTCGVVCTDRKQLHANLDRMLDGIEKHEAAAKK